MNPVPTPASTATETQPDQVGAPVSRRDVVILICWLLACGGLVFARGFGTPYSYDDIAHLQALATLRSGEMSFFSWFFLNHNEHIVPLLRLYYMVGTRISGLSSAATHVLIFLNYIVGAFACAWISLSLTRSRLGAFLAGTIFAGAGGCAGSIVWQSTDAQFSVAGTPLILAIAILVSPLARRRWSNVAVLLLIVVSAMGMGGIVVAALSIPLYLFLARPGTMATARRWWMIGLSLSLSGVLLLITSWLMARHGIHGPKFTMAGVRYGLFLVLLTPGRFLMTWTPFEDPALPTAVALSVAGWLLLIASVRWVPKPLRTLLLSLWVGNGLLAVLIGIGRYNIFTYPDLFHTDRYHYFFLLPLALQTAAILDRLTRRLLQKTTPPWRGAVIGALGCAMLAALVMSHIRMGKGILWPTIAEYKTEFREAKVLAKIVRRVAAGQNLHLADGPIRFPGTLDEHLGFSAIIFAQFPKGLPGVVWSLSSIPTASVGWPYRVRPISDADAAVQNQIFDEWSKRINRPPYTCVIGGKVHDVLPVSSCAEAAKMSPPPIAPPKPFN